MTRPSHQFTVIVSGLPRSGTSMMMQMLEAGGIEVLTDGVRSADADNPRGYYEFEPVKRTKADASWLDGSEGRAVKMVHALLRDLPTDRQYRVILMHRDLSEVIASQAAMLERLGKEGASLSDERLAQVFQRQLHDVLTYLHSQHCFQVREVWYDAVLREPLAEAERISEFLGRELDTRKMAAVVDPTLYRQKRQ